MLTQDRSSTPSRPVGPETWFPGAAAGGDGLRLVCFSYAGGTPSLYRGWQAHLGSQVQVVPVLLPGRGRRLRETPYTEVRAIAVDVTTALADGHLTDRCAFFGHSMGALLAYEVACELRRRGLPEPLHLFASGSRPPHAYGGRADHALPDDELRQLVRRLGSPGASLADADHSRRLSVLRADLEACDTYRWSPRPPLLCPMTAFSGSEDPIAPPTLVEGWRGYTRSSLVHRQLPGDHFYLAGSSRPRLLAELRRQLTALAADLRRATGTTPSPRTA